MQSNVRFYVLVTVVIAVLAGAWYAISGKKAEVQSQPQAAQSAKEPEKPAPSTLEPLGESSSRAVRGNQSMRSVLSGTTAATTESKTGDGSITGIVKDPRGNPASGATVRILAMSWKSFEARPADVATEEMQTGSDGTFSFTKLPEKMSFGVEAELGPQYAVAHVYVNDREKTADVTLTLMPTSYIAGTVVNPEGEPVAGAELYAAQWLGQSDDLPYTETEIARQLTDESGAFRFPHAPMGKFKFLVKSTGYAPLLTDWVVSGTDSAKFVLRKGGSIAGRVVYVDSREPAGNVTVVARTGVSREEQRQDSGSDGAFSFTNLRDTSIDLSIDSETLVVAKQSEKIALAPAQNVTNIEIEINKGGSVSGRVIDAKSTKGVRNARLQLHTDSRGGGAISVYKDATTDEDGAYSIGGLPAGSYAIYVGQAEGYVSDDYQKRQVISVATGQSVEDVDFTLESGSTLAGRVVDEAGKPVEKARINVTSRRGGRWASAESDVNGLFTVMGVAAESEVFARADKKGLTSSPVGPFDATGGEVNDVVITLLKEATISGVVVDDAGKPVPRAQVIPYKVDGDRQGFGSPIDHADEKGEFKLERLAEGEYQLQATINDAGWMHNPNAEKIRVAAGEAKTDVRIVLEGAGSLSIAGKVTGEDGKPVRSAQLWVMGRNSNANAQTDSDGRYKVSGLKEGDYSISAQAEGYSRGSLSGISAGSENADIVLKGAGKIEGKVVDAATGKPVTDFEILYAGNAGTDMRSFRHMGPGSRTRSEDGSFHIENAEAGNATLLVKGQGYAPAIHVVTDIAPGKTKSGVVISLEPGGTVAGRVLDTAGNPIAGAQVYDTPLPLADYTRERSVRTTSADDGSFQVDGLPSGYVTISAYHTGFAGANIEVNVTSGKTAQANIVLSGGGTVRIRVTENGVPAIGAYAGIQENVASDSTAKEPDENGFAEFTSVPPGSYSAYGGVRDVGGSGIPNRNQRRDITVTEGNVTEVAFDFSAGMASLNGTVTFNGQPPTRAWVSVTLVASDTAGEEIRGVEVEPNGQFRMENLPAGQARIRAQGAVGENSSGSRLVTVVLVDGKATDVTIELGGGGSVSGTVSGIPPGSQVAVVVVRGAFNPPAHMSQVEFSQLYRDDLIAGGGNANNTTGAFTLGNVEPGQYTLLATAPDKAGNLRYATAPVRVTEGQTSTVSLALPR